MKLSIEVLKTLIDNSFVDSRKKNVMGKCPWCGCMEFGVSTLDNHRFGCFRKNQCGETGNVFKLLKKVGRLDLLERPDSITVSLSPVLKNEIITPKIEVEELPIIKPPLGFRRIYEHPYLENRGFSSQDFKDYEIGITKLDPKLKDYIIFLIRKQGNLVAYVSRYIKSKDEIKAIELRTGKHISRYRNSNTDFTQLLLGLDECTEKTTTAILVEGLFGKKNIDDKLGLRSQDEIKCLCTFGAKISDLQIYQLHQKGIENIVLMFDPDVIPYIKKYANRLAEEFSSVRVAMIPWRDKDPGDLNEEEVDQVFNNLKDVLNFQLNVVEVLRLK